MNRTQLFAVCAMLLLPYLVSIDGDSSDVPTTFVELAVGKGLYADVSRDCSGAVVSVDKRPFFDAGARIVHKVSSLRLAAGAGVTSGDRNDVPSGYPYNNTGLGTTPYGTGTIGLDNEYFAFDLGALVMFESEKPAVLPAGNLRLGSRSEYFLSLGIAQNTPLLAGNSLGDIGVGVNLGLPNSLLWIGWGQYPYDSRSGLFSVKMDYPLSDRLLLQPRFGIGLGGFGEYTFSLGTRIYL